jgi:ubiquinone biosynthesis protein UbiJ
MSDTQQRHKHPHLLLNIVIIVLETFFSFILTHDATLRLQAKKLIDEKVTIRINSYIPFFDFYVQFTEKGILFDMKALDRKVDLEINSTLIDLIKIFVFNNQRSIYNMRILGDARLQEDVMDLIPHLTLTSIFANWKQWFNAFNNDAEAIASQQRIAPLLDKIDQQRSEINTLLVEVKQYQNRIHRMQKRQRLINIGFAVLSFIFIAFFVYTMWIQ